MDLQDAVLSYNQEASLKITRSILDSGCRVETFYENYLFKIIKSIGKEIKPEIYDIAKEHLSTGIIRAIIEICYEYILKEQPKKNNKSVLVCSLENELHEIPARIVSDFFTLNGYKSFYLGVNLPNEHIVNAINHLDVDYVAISVTNHLHLTKLGETIKCIKANGKTKIVVGGLAVINNLEYTSTLNADYVIKDLKQIGAIQ